MISYAQNFEDVMLWRALKSVAQGFYVDIGAQDPVVDSVSAGLYELGWRGVHVEPVPQFAQALRDARPDERVVQVAIGTSDALIPFFEIPNTGISTGDAEIAARHRESGYSVRQIDVPCITLAALFDSLPQREVHWLKVDVEGMEEQVLRSWPPSPVRPWVVVVEATAPRTSEPSFAGWEPLLIGLGYRFAYTDGLNRFYVSEHHLELLPSFATPPNVFDAFSLSGSASNGFAYVLNQNIERARAERTALDAQLVALRQELDAQREATKAEAQFRHRLAERELALEAQRQHAQELGRALEQVSATHDEVALQLAVSTQQNATTARELDVTRSTAAALDARVAELQAQVAQLQIDLAHERARADRLREELDRTPRERVRALLSKPRLSGLLGRGAAPAETTVEATAVMTTPAPGASVASLLTHYDVAFVREVYTVLLGREVDPAGLENYLTKLRQGTTRESVIVDVARSDEAKKLGREVAGVRELIEEDLASRKLGRRLQRSLRGDANESLAKAIRAQENRAAVTTDELNARLDRLEATLASAERANEVWRALAQGTAMDELRNLTRTREVHRRLQDELFHRLKAAIKR